MKTLCVTLFLIAVFVVSAEARLFTDDQGRQVEAEIVGVNGANVVLDRNGQSAQWPINKLSNEDQDYVKAWLKDSPSSPKIRVNIWEREGIGEAGRFQEKSSGLEIPKNIPMLKSTEETEKYRYYDVDMSNLSGVDAREVFLSYVVYVIDETNKVVDFAGSESVELIKAEGRETRATQAVTYVRTKTTSMTFNVGVLGNLSTGTNTDRSKERFGGAWARVYSADGELLGERKQLHDELERLDFRFTGSTGETFGELPILESFEKLKELLDKLPKPPAGFPKPPSGFPKPPGGLPKPPFGRP